MKDVIIRQIPVGDYKVLTHIVACPVTRAAVIIDPAGEEEKIVTLPKETVIWPGHDYGDRPFSTFQREMEENVYITDFILDR
jgi:hypothetical protein